MWGTERGFLVWVGRGAKMQWDLFLFGGRGACLGFGRVGLIERVLDWLWNWE